MTFQEFYRRLILHIQERVRSGQLTERALARLTGISQPHIHNVLKGKRIFSAPVADQILHALKLDLLDLVEPAELLEWRRRH